MKEIEIKLVYKNKKSIEKILISQNAKKIGTIKIRDSYFSPTGSGMSNINDLVRIREQNSQDIELTYKGGCLDRNNVWERLEVTVQVNSFKKMEKILLALGLKKIKENESIRTIWKKDNLEIIFLSFSKPKKLNLLEIEGPSTQEVESFVKKIGDLTKRVGEEIFDIFD